MDNEIFFKQTDIEHQQRLSMIFDQKDSGHSSVPKKSEDEIHLKNFQSEYNFQEDGSNSDDDMKDLSFLTTLDNTIANQAAENTTKFFEQSNQSMYPKNQNYNIHFSNEFLNSSFVANGNKRHKSDSDSSFKSPNPVDPSQAMNQFYLSSSMKDILNKDLATIEKNNSHIIDSMDADVVKPKKNKVAILRSSKNLQPPAMLPKSTKRNISATSDDKKKVVKKIKVKSLKDVIKRPQIGNGMDFFQKFNLNYSIGQITRNICQNDSTLINNQKYYKSSKNVAEFDQMISGLEQDIANYQNVCERFKDSHFT